MRTRNGKTTKIIFAALVLFGFVLALSVSASAQSLDPKLLWRKEFKWKINSLDLATESGDVILSLVSGEIILLNKNGKERFHWGPRVDRGGGAVSISKDGKYFGFGTGYTEKYAYQKDIDWSADDRIHFYNGQTKKELWNKRNEGTPLIFPDGKSLISKGFSGGSFYIFGADGKQIYSYGEALGIPSFEISPDSNYFAFVKDDMQPLILFKRDGTKIWERGRHDSVASISEGASYISTSPYLLVDSYSADAQESHKGLVYDKSGNIVMKGFGIVTGDGSKIAMLFPEKISILSLPDGKIIKEIIAHMSEIFLVSWVSNILFSYDGRYIIIKSKTSMSVYDLLENIYREIPISVSELGKYPRFRATRNGQFLLISPDSPRNKSGLYYYQLY